jgi:MFS family permease
VPQSFPRSDHADTPRSWLAVAVAFIVGFVVFGILYSFGSFLDPMMTEFAASRTSVSALFSVSGLLFYLAGPIAGRFGDRFGPRPMVTSGALLLAASLGSTALIGRIWVGYLTYSVGVAVGLACVYTPSLAIVGGWFVRRRNVALGMAATGTGCGTLVLPPLAAALIAAYGWRPACTILAGICGVLLLIAAALVSPPPGGTVTARRLGQSVQSQPFLLLYVSWVTATTGLYVAFVFLPVFARQHGVEPVAASSLVSVIGGVSIAGRMGMGVFGRWVGTVRLYQIAVFTMAGSYLLWLSANGYAGMLVFAVVFGLGYGIRIALTPVVLIEFFGLGNLGALLGAFFTASGIAAFVGPLVAAAIVDATGGFDARIGFSFVLGCVGFLVLLPLRNVSTTLIRPRSDCRLDSSASTERLLSGQED